VDDSLHVSSNLVDSEVHAEFAGHLSCAGKLPPFEVDDDHVGRAHEVLAHAGGRNQ